MSPLRAYCDLSHPGTDAEADDWCSRYHCPVKPSTSSFDDCPGCEDGDPEVGAFCSDCVREIRSEEYAIARGEDF